MLCIGTEFATTVGNQNFILTDVQAPDGRILLIGSLSDFQLLIQSDITFGDGMFSTLPNLPGFVQLYTFLGIHLSECLVV